MKRLSNVLFSMKLTGILLVLFTFSIAYATFIENDFGTLVAKYRVYNSRWLEIIYLLMVINLTGSIIKHKLYLRNKLPILLFHVSFIIILLGSAITRYIGYEGVMNIREGKTANEFQSEKTYISLLVQDDTYEVSKEKEIIPIASDVLKYSADLSFHSYDIYFDVLEYYTNATETYVEDDDGEEVVSIIVSDGMSSQKNIDIKKGEVIKIGDISFSFAADFAGKGINIFKGAELSFIPGDSVIHKDMKTKESKLLLPDSIYSFQQNDIYKVGNINFALKNYYESAVKTLGSNYEVDGSQHPDAFKAEITVNGQSKIVYVYGGDGFLTRDTEINVNDLNFRINYGSKIIMLPFSLKLNDFDLDRYPGSKSPASYASDITIIDKENEVVMPYRIYMNNVLNYGGYRFFQSSYDRDEKGTILTVSHDTAGTIITYIGYILMTIGIVLSIFIKNSRFKSLLRLSKKLRQSRKEVVTVFLVTLFVSGLHFSSIGQNTEDPEVPVIGIEHAKDFGRLLVQDHNGRIKPINTAASEVLRKISRKNSFMNMIPEQVLLGIMVYPEIWQDIPIIKVTNPQLKEFLGVKGNYAAFSQIVDVKSSGKYKIMEFVENAYAKKPAKRNKFDKDVMQVDERANIFYMAFYGSLLRIFPVPNDINQTWVSSDKANEFTNTIDSEFVRSALSNYYRAVANAVESGDWQPADNILKSIEEFQDKYGKEIILSDSKIKVELLYNKLDIFKRLVSYYGLIGFILLICHFIAIFRPKMNLKILINISKIIIIILFVMHTGGLILRWYIAGHAPWSDGYESLLFIGWATIFAGLIFVNRSEITLSLTALLSSLILSVAGMSWMDPEITNLVPVLQSYWLIIHVAVITASYGFLALGALLGFFNMIMMILKSKNNFHRLNLTVKELSYIIEMTLIIGLYLLTIGTFLGGVWANESWGRYWGWDPKETWALATVVFYAFVLHMRFIPGLRGHFAFSFMALISYSFVIMTYFGVNYYLSGLHSYAGGDPVPVPAFVYYTLIIIGVVSVIAYFSDKKYNKTEAVS